MSGVLGGRSGDHPTESQCWDEFWDVLIPELVSAHVEGRLPHPSEYGVVVQPVAA